MQLFGIVSFTHKNTHIDIRENLSLNADDKSRLYPLLLEFLDEVMILSTCNRVEIYFFKNSQSEFAHFQDKSDVLEAYCIRIIQNIKQIKNISTTLEPTLYFLKDAIRHLYTVASSLDSLVIGETQITGQLKEAFKFAYANNFCNENMAFYLNNALRCASAIRNNTSISTSSLSIASVAVKYALAQSNIQKALIIGTGEMGILSLKHLINAGVEITILSRNITNGHIDKFADLMESSEDCRKYKYKNVNIILLELKNLANIINDYELIISATSASGFIITDDMLRPINRPRMFFDLAIPRDIDITTSGTTKLYSVDDLVKFVNKNLEHKQEQGRIAEEILENMLEKLDQNTSTSKLLKTLHLKAYEAISSSLESAIKKGHIAPNQSENTKKLMINAFNKFLHNPSNKLKQTSDKNIIEGINFLFD